MTIDVPTESPQGTILNYSIISSDEEENPLILKLKVSENNKAKKVPLVMLERLENDSSYVASPKSSDRIKKAKVFDGFEMDLTETNIRAVKNGTSTPKKRGGTKVEVDVPSPTKIRRSLRTPKKKDIDALDNLCMSITNKVTLTTPVKKPLDKIDLSPKKMESTPRSTRKLDSLSPMKVDENELVCSGKRRSCAPRRFIDEYSPSRSVKVNLNESFRRAVLKSRHNVENIGATLRRSSRKSYSSNFYYDSYYDDAMQVAEALGKSEIEVSTSKRVLRSRSNSTASNGSVTSDISDYAASNGSRTRSRKNSIVSISSENIDESPPKQSVPRTPKTSDISDYAASNGSRTRLRKNSIVSVSSENIDESPPRQSVPRTPKTPRRRAKSVQNTPKTPKNRLKMLRAGVITPSMHSRSSLIPGDSTPLMKARSQLHVSYVPTSLPCREKEYLDVYNFLRGKLDDGCGGCMYISGVPGTGKTASVTSVIDSLANDKKVPKFSYVSINGMRLTEPRQAYVEIWKQLTGKTVPWEQAQSLLEERFTKKKHLSPVVMLIDELDILCTKRQDVVYNLLDWPTKSKDQLVVITIANTMDLPERLLMSRVTSRLGLTRLTFQAYTHKQLMEIVTKRLMGTDSFNSDAIQLVARKVASVSGDARRALDICRRAAEIAEEEGKGQMVNIMHINEALTAMITQPQVMAIRRCSRLQKLLLQAVVAEIERTGVEETTFADTFKMLVSCCALDGFKMVSSTAAQRALCQLSACKLILTDQKCCDINQRIILNVSVHDVYFALKKE